MSIWTAYEAVEGVPLLHSKTAPKDRLTAVTVIADVLQACHQAGVLHRALTSDCIVIPHGQRTPVLLHFDFARVQGKPSIAGTRIKKALQESLYVAPEVRRDPSRVSPAADVYSLGIVTLEALVGHHLKTSEAIAQALRGVGPKELKAFVGRMMKPVPESRPPIQEVVQTLRKATR